MKFHLHNAYEILGKTPALLKVNLENLSQEWLYSNEGEGTWSPYNIVGHLIVGEKTDWITRTKVILSNSENKTFIPFDRFAQEKEDQTRPIADLLDEFQQLRNQNIATLKSLNLQKNHFTLEGIHPELGTVTLKQLLATWVVHDLGHIAQISRVMAKQYQEEVGPWTNYLNILHR